jgi:hypothetical protein
LPFAGAFATRLERTGARVAAAGCSEEASSQPAAPAQPKIDAASKSARSAERAVSDGVTIAPR